MKVKRLLPALFTLAALLLEVLPYGVCLNFANPEGDSFRRLFSFFSLTPYGYGQVFPFFCALLTVALLPLTTAYFLKPKRGLLLAVRILSFSVVLFLFLSYCFFGFLYITYVGIAVLMVMLACLVTTFIPA
jgi:hypothetical protein